VRSDETTIGTLVDEISPWFIRHGVDPHFRVSPLSRPSNLAAILETRGFLRTETETQMVLAGEDVEPPSNSRITIEPVSPLDLLTWVTLQHHAFGGTGEPSGVLMEIARVSADAGNSRPYLVRLDGAPVGAGSLTEWAGAFGIYGVAVAQEARKQGAGTALVRHMVQEVKLRGNAPLCLQVQTGSAIQGWYERLGFRVVYDRTGWTRKVT
jgi:ribosomal protein S18 acetylase RimI-like enzyme